jgi:hypothetical protein
MSQPVWTLSVDLQTKTATFQTGMADAAKAAKLSFAEIKDGAREMGTDTSYSLTEARHGVMLLGEEFGVHLPRGITSFIASLGPVGSAMEAAFPFLALLVGATLLLEHLAKLKEAGEKLTESQTNFGTTVANVMNAWDAKLLEAGIRADELNGNHIGALHKQLELIDRQSLKELAQSFDEVAKSADVTFAQLKTSWYSFSSGSAGAKASLEKFKAEYDLLLAQGKNDEATKLLDAKVEREQRILDLQKQQNANQVTTGSQGTHGDYGKAEAAAIELKKLGVGYTDKEVQAQETLVGVLQATVALEQKRADLKAMQSSYATQTTANKMNDDGDRAAREQAQSIKQANEDAQKEWEANYRAAVSALQENEKEKIDATEKGSAARLAAISAAIQEENSKGLQETGFYKGLLQDRVNITREMSDEQSKLTAEAGKQDADQFLRMGELRIEAERQQAALMDSAHRVTAQQRITEDTKFADEEYQLKLQSLNKEIAALDKNGRDYQNKLKELQNKETELTRQHENQITQIKEQAEEERNRRILAANSKLSDDLAKNMTQVLMRNESFSKMMVNLGNEVVGGMLENAIKSIMMNDMTKESDAAAAARKAFLAGMHFPFPANIVMGPALGAAAFASVMAFEEGGLVPGVENFDSVNAKLTPGEAVLPKEVTEKLSRATGDSSDTRPHFAIHVNHAPQIHALDAAGVDKVLEKNAATFQKHFERTIRKLNK